ncbi:MAG: hypothetical protein WBM84_12295, partial [Sedimenticolaceae bacterium]
GNTDRGALGEIVLKKTEGLRQSAPHETTYLGFNPGVGLWVEDSISAEPATQAGLDATVIRNQ